MSAVLKSNFTDINTIFTFYEDAVAYQKTKFNKHWLPFDRGMVEREVANGLQWKIMEGDQVACVFAIAFEDPFIWAEKNKDPAIYIHRIVTHSAFRGGGYVKTIIEWAKQYSKENDKRFIRMDTWGDNEELINYYVKCGFDYLGTITPQATENLPKHYSSIFLSLFEIKV